MVDVVIDGIGILGVDLGVGAGVGRDKCGDEDDV